MEALFVSYKMTTSDPSHTECIVTENYLLRLFLCVIHLSNYASLSNLHSIAHVNASLRLKGKRRPLFFLSFLSFFTSFQIEKLGQSTTSEEKLH